MIDNYDFWEMDAAKYFSFPKKYTKAEKKEKSKIFVPKRFLSWV